MTQRLVLLCVVVAATAVGCRVPPSVGSGPRHLALNTTPDDDARLTELGYDVFDTGPSADEIAALPEGAQAMLWVGDFSCEGGFGIPDDGFTALVDELGDDEHAPGQVAYVSATDYEYAPLRPENSHLDQIGLDPYPCIGASASEHSCDMGVIDTFVGDATAAGFPVDVIVPVIQLFGQECADADTITLPSEDELRQILDRWSELVPDPELEISYSWGNQQEWACPTLADADGSDDLPDLQSIMKAHNAAAPG